MVVVHGLWMQGPELGYLRHRLSHDHGYAAVPFRYQSVSGSMQEHVASLRAFMSGLRTDTVHLVGHSLGGVVVLKLLESASDLPPGRAVLLGSPLLGSRAAQGAARWPLARPLLGRAILEEVIRGEGRTWDGRRDVGVIAGSVRMGLGRFFGHLEGEHDGTVLVEETQLPGIRDHLVLPVTHTGMLFSAEVAAAVARFLRSGAFQARVADNASGRS